MNRQENAEIHALKALSWLLQQPDLAGLFLNACGADAGQLAVRAADPAFLGGVLDFLMEDDARVMGFCDAEGLPYTLPMQIRADLPGGQHWHWT